MAVGTIPRLRFGSGMVIILSVTVVAVDKIFGQVGLAFLDNRGIGRIAVAIGAAEVAVVDMLYHHIRIVTLQAAGRRYPDIIMGADMVAGSMALPAVGLSGMADGAVVVCR